MAVAVNDKTSAQGAGHEYVAKAQGTQWRKFSRCRISVSVGQPYHEGGKLAAVVDWVNQRHTMPFERCDVLLADSLQRHNLSGTGIQADVARQLAARAGDSWLRRNEQLLDALQVPWRVLRWDECLSNVRYEAVREQVEEVYRSNAVLTDTLDADVHDFVARSLRRGVTDVKRAAFVSRRYLLEELAVDALLGEERPAADIYPRQWQRVYRVLAFHPVADLPPGLRPMASAFVRLRLRRQRVAVAGGHADPPSQADSVATS